MNTETLLAQLWMLCQMLQGLIVAIIKDVSWIATASGHPLKHLQVTCSKMSSYMNNNNSVKALVLKLTHRFYT